MAVNGEVKILPMMYLALSYDHRLIDGKEAVQFLVTIKDLLGRSGSHLIGNLNSFHCKMFAVFPGVVLLCQYTAHSNDYY